MSFINTRKKRRESKLVRISSRDRASASSTNKYNFNINFDDYFLHQIQGVIVKSIIIPNSQYNINANNNTIFYDYNGAGIASVQIPIGQYNLNDFMTALDLAFVTAGIALVTTQDPLTLKLILTFPNPTILYDSFAGTTINEVLGYEFTTANLAVQNMPNLPDLSGLQKVFIKSNTLSNGVSMSNSEKKHVNVFTEVDIAVGFGAIEHRVLDTLDTSDEITNSQPKNISSIDIQLLDQNFNQVDLNGLEWEMVLKVFN
jgi:hypothetical protein